VIVNLPHSIAFPVARSLRVRPEIRNGWFTSNRADRFPTHILGQFRPDVLAIPLGFFIPTNKKFFGITSG
jgi:hypothetical protein